MFPNEAARKRSRRFSSASRSLSINLTLPKNRSSESTTPQITKNEEKSLNPVPREIATLTVTAGFFNNNNSNNIYDVKNFGGVYERVGVLI